MKDPKRTLKNFLYALVVWVGMVAYTAFKGRVEEVFEGPLKPIGEQFKKVFALHAECQFWQALGKTVFVFGATLFAAAVAGICLGLLVHYNRWAGKWLAPFIPIFKPIPAIAMIALGTLLFGSGAAAIPWFVAFFGAIWPFAASITEGLNKIPKEYEESALTLGKSKKEIVKEVIVPAVTPDVFGALRVTAPIALLLTVTAEYFYPSVGGLGALLNEFHTQLKYSLVVTMVCWMSLLSIAAETLLNELERKMCKWKNYD